MTAAEFEDWVAKFMKSLGAATPGFEVTRHEKVAGSDGTYDIDATARYEVAGVNHLMLIEAKRHKNSIKRELVQALFQKVQSTGAHKGVLVATAPFQSGAIDFAIAHGIALVAVTEGRYTMLTKSLDPRPTLSRELAASRFGLPIFVGTAIYEGSSATSIGFGTIDLDDPERTARLVLGA